MITSQPERPICKTCNTNVAKISGKSALGFDSYGSECNTCHKIRYNLKEGKRRVQYKKYKESTCGFIPEHKSQLDVHHLDGDKHNNEKRNLQTLCANCHRLVTHLGSTALP